MNVDGHLEILKIKKINNDEIDIHFKSDKMLDVVLINNTFTLPKNHTEKKVSCYIYNCDIDYDVINNITSNIQVSILINGHEFKLTDKITLPIISMKNSKIQFKIYSENIVNDSGIHINFDGYIFSNLVRLEFNYYNKLIIQTNYGMKFKNGFIKI